MTLCVTLGQWVMAPHTSMGTWRVETRALVGGQASLGLTAHCACYCQVPRHITSPETSLYSSVKWGQLYLLSAVHLESSGGWIWDRPGTHQALGQSESPPLPERSCLTSWQSPCPQGLVQIPHPGSPRGGDVTGSAVVLAPTGTGWAAVEGACCPSGSVPRPPSKMGPYPPPIAFSSPHHPGSHCFPESHPGQE